MIRNILLASFLVLSALPFVPAADACIIGCGPIPNPCGPTANCEVPGLPPIECTEVCQPCMTISCPEAGPSIGPLVGVCLDEKHTGTKCYGGHDVCVGFSYEVPFCVDLPGIACGQLVCGPHPIPVSVCAKENACDQGHDVCIQYGMTPPACQDFPECACMPMSGPSVPPPCACPPPQAHSAQCTAVVGSGAAAAVCVVDGETYGPVRTCDTCAVLFQVVCTAGTEGIRCW